MTEDRSNKLKKLISTTESRTKRTYSLWQLLTYHNNSISTEELFSYIPLIWKIDISNKKYFGVRQKLENEIRKRQNNETILSLLKLLKHDDPNLRFVATDLLNHFKSEIIIEPLLMYLKHTTDPILTRKQAICALKHYKDERIKSFLNKELENNKANPETFFRNNYIKTIESVIEKVS